ncbi:MAG TPA: hypothetical protein DEP69_06255 [Acidimicrobiaceae bacterium]|nr:hypothetical protein [Acidimicrobiaceae bacterium]
MVSDSEPPDAGPDGQLTGRQWAAAFAAQLSAAQAGREVPAPDDDTVDTLLELAGVAAHDSERIAAPIACWLVGVAGIAPDEALALAKEFVRARRAG